MLKRSTKLLTPSVQLPLHGKRIIVTAPRNYAARLSGQLINQGGMPFLMPTIETCSLENFTDLDAALQHIDAFDWIAFTSRNGIDAFFQRLEDLEINPLVLTKCRFCAIGLDSERLAALGVKVDLVPKEPSPAGVIAQLAKIPDIAQKNVLVPVPEVVGVPEPDVIPNFIAGLEKLGMKVTRVPTYRTRCLDKDIYEVELNLIRQGKIDVIAFSSTVEVVGFLQMVDSKRDYEHCAIACFGPYTAANAKKLGLNVSIVAQDYSSFAGFALAIALWALQ
ncbi:uroporphyrinogen-III synthase [Brasilonema sp. UFV-L1]|uniref:uroporphyrinogen-III synthase n=1 Tax=Brasilonema sp. UFV-L1 TaxID=2234130 RepID=UPI00145F32CB|nr:uroporphyrinogen-III synthase [Brasilonema sp. UFV-L1]NMG07285.1 uroporphyrinogen-III synthase [Brasilonema sp. UFV-L1]